MWKRWFHASSVELMLHHSLKRSMTPSLTAKVDGLVVHYSLDKIAVKLETEQLWAEHAVNATLVYSIMTSQWLKEMWANSWRLHTDTQQHLVNVTHVFVL